MVFGALEADLQVPLSGAAILLRLRLFCHSQLHGAHVGDRLMTSKPQPCLGLRSDPVDPGQGVVLQGAIAAHHLASLLHQEESDGQRRHADGRQQHMLLAHEHQRHDLRNSNGE